MAAKDDAPAPASTPEGAAKPDGAEKPAAEEPATEKPAADATIDDTKKPEDGSKEPARKDDSAKPESKAPEKYALKLPDGGRIDAQDLATIETIARAQNWTNDEAQQRVNDHAAAIEAQSAQFMETTKADPVYGGANLRETLKHARAAIDKFRPEDHPRAKSFQGLLDKSGYGNHPDIVSYLADVGKAMAEDQPGSAHQTAAGSTTPKSDVKSSADVGAVLYGKA